MTYWLSLVCSGSIKACYSQKTLAKSKYLFGIVISSVSKKAIWAFLFERIDFKLRKDT